MLVHRRGDALPVLEREGIHLQLPYPFGPTETGSQLAMEILGWDLYSVRKSGRMSASPSPPSPAAARRSHRGLLAAVAVIAVALIVVGALYGLGIGPFSSSSGPSGPTGSSGGFTQGQAVTLTYSGAYFCTPSLAQLFPDAAALNATTPCEIGDADQNAVSNQIPQWLLVPAFAGLSAFGDTSAGATSQGYPSLNGSTVLTDCAAGASALRCPQTPATIYSPTFAAMEQFANLSGGVNGLAQGLLPMPAHDILINTTAHLGSPIPWGTIVVLVFDPNIFPDRSNGACAAIEPSNLSIPTGNCLTSLTALDHALVTSSSAVVGANGGSANNPVWKSLGGPLPQVYAIDDLNVNALNNNLNSDLYEAYGVSPSSPTFAGP